jgi:hypothetical protein
LANSAVTVAKISASGTPSSTTFLRGDGSWQAAGGGASGQAAQLFTSSGTFTVPAGVTAVKVTVVGGGGGGGGSWTQNAGAGGTTSFGAFVSATGGGGGQGGSSNLGGTGGSGGTSSSSFLFSPGNQGGRGYTQSSAYSTIDVAGSGSFPDTPYFSGNRGRGGNATAAGGGGGGGGTGISWVTGLTPGSTVSVTIGGAGSTFNGAAVGGACLVEW